MTREGREFCKRLRVEALIERRLKGIYRIFVRLGSPEFFIRYHSIAHQGYFRGVLMKITFDGANKAIIKFTGFEKQHKLMERSIIGFYKKALETFGAKNVHTKYLTLIEENKGYCELEIT